MGHIIEEIEKEQDVGIEKALDGLFPGSSAPKGDLMDGMYEEKRQELFRLHDTLCKEALALMRLKNQDYGGKNDPFANFHKYGELGIMVRLNDKIARLESFMEKGFNCVKSESVKDTVIDGINYFILWYAFLQQKGALDEH